MGDSPPVCVECQGVIPLGGGSPAHLQFRKYCSMKCRDKADNRQRRIKRYTLQWLVDDGWAIECKPYGPGGSVIGRAERNGSVQVVKGATVQTVLEKLWTATRNTTDRGGRWSEAEPLPSTI